MVHAELLEEKNQLLQAIYPVVINDIQVCLYLDSQYSLVLSLCSSKHKFCEARSMAFKSLWLFVIIVYTFLDVQSNIACKSWFFSSSSSKSFDGGYLRERSWFQVIQKIFRVFQNPHVIYATTRVNCFTIFLLYRTRACTLQRLHRVMIICFIS
jgi:hypothetical protein